MFKIWTKESFLKIFLIIVVRKKIPGRCDINTKPEIYEELIEKLYLKNEKLYTYMV